MAVVCRLSIADRFPVCVGAPSCGFRQPCRQTPSWTVAHPFERQLSSRRRQGVRWLKPSGKSYILPSQSGGGNRKNLEPWSPLYKWAELRKRINKSCAHPPTVARRYPETALRTLPDRPRHRRCRARYEAGETTQQIGNRYAVTSVEALTSRIQTLAELIEDVRVP